MVLAQRAADQSKSGPTRTKLKQLEQEGTGKEDVLIECDAIKQLASMQVKGDKAAI